MSDLGPAWLRKELPHPIAKAWNYALLGVPIDGIAAASAVEVSLRFVTGLQLANLIAEGSVTPAILANGTFKRPTLGSWVMLAKTLRDAIAKPFAPALASWPDARADKLLDQLTRERNRLAHAGQMSPGVRRDLESSVAQLASDVLETLDWLRRLELVSIVDARLAADGRIEGRLQVFRSTEPHPEHQRASWRGQPALDHLYLASSEPGARNLLDVEPFIRRARLATAKVEAICLWKGYGQRSDILSSDDPQEAAEWVPLGTRVRFVPFARQPTAPTSTDVTRHESAVPEAPTFVDNPVSLPPGKPVPARRSRRWLIPTLLFVVAAGSVAAAMTLTTRSRPNLTGAWVFDTHVLTSWPKMEYGLNVNGHYAVTFRDENGSAVPTVLVKRGYTQSGTFYEADQSQELRFNFSASGRSVAAYAQLRKTPSEAPAEIAMRLALVDDLLVGLWRHEGDEWQRGGYSGAILGTRASGTSVASAPRNQCFVGCIKGCYHGTSPLDNATESCVLDCTRRLNDCPTR